MRSWILGVPEIYVASSEAGQVLEVRNFAKRASTSLHWWEDALGMPVALFILPMFALTNASVVFEFSSFIESLQHPIGLVITAGLILGKLIGISGASVFVIVLMSKSVKFRSRITNAIVLFID